MSELKISDSTFYNNEEGTVKVNVIVGDDTVWLTEIAMTELFNVPEPVISGYIDNIFKDGELTKSSVVTNVMFEKLGEIGEKGGKENVEFYNLDMIIAVGYRANPFQATKFRLWAESLFTKHKILREKKGFRNASGTINPVEKLPAKVIKTNREKLSNFDKQLKGLLSVSPPKKGKSNED